MTRRKTERRPKTPALARLDQAGTEYAVHEFRHDPDTSDFGDEAARALGVDPAQVFKTLIWRVDNSFAVGLVPATTNTSPKKLAAAVGARRAQLAERAEAERLSGSVTGAISPLGLRRPLRVVVDVSAVDHEQIFVSAGRRGMEVSLSPYDLIGLTEAIVASIRT